MYNNCCNKPSFIFDDSKYTIRVKDMLDHGIELNFDNIIFYSDDKAKEIKEAIIDHFLFREIGYESVGEFNHALNRRMKLIMPVFNKFIELDNSITDWFENVNYTVLQEIKENEDTTLERTQEQIEAMSGNEKGTADSTATSDITEAGTLSNTKNDESTGNKSSTDGGTEQLEVTGNKTDSGTTKLDRTGTEETNTIVETNENLFKVGSDLPQDMVLRQQIEDNVWASTAEKNNNTSSADTESTLTLNTSDTTTHGKKEDTTNNSTTTFGKTNNVDTTDTLTSTVEQTTSDSTNKKDTSNIESIIDTMRNTNLNGMLNDTGNKNSLNNLVRNIKGNIGPKYFSELLIMARAAVINIPQMIINELENLFMGVW